jgi:serine/threonine protein kinase
VLKYLDNDLLTESNKKRLSQPEIKYIAKSGLQALKVVHNDGMVHTGIVLLPSFIGVSLCQIEPYIDIKLDNIFVNYGKEQRLSDVQLGDCGRVVSQDSGVAKEGHVVGAGFTRSQEVTFQLPWRTSTDIWSFGNAVR